MLNEKNSRATIGESVLLTRSVQNNQEAKKLLTRAGFEVLECNLIEYAALTFSLHDIKDETIIIVTSHFVACNLPNMIANKVIRVLVVGDKSAGILQLKGYLILAVVQNVYELRDLLSTQQVPINRSDILYLSGDNITMDMPEYVTRRIIYNVKYLDALSTTQVVRYKQGIDYILLYSQNCAKVLLKLLMQNDLLYYLSDATVIAISARVSAVVENSFSNIIVSTKPTSMLNYISRDLGT